jgi:hypothetical protein
MCVCVCVCVCMCVRINLPVCVRVSIALVCARGTRGVSAIADYEPGRADVLPGYGVCVCVYIYMWCGGSVGIVCV